LEEGGAFEITDCGLKWRVGMTAAKNNGATLGFEETLWQAADKPRRVTNGSCGSLRPRRVKDEIRKNLKGLGFDV